MAGKMRVVLFLALLVLFTVGTVQADMVFPLAVGYTANYNASDDTDSWTSTLSVISSTTPDGHGWVMQMNNWNSPTDGLNLMNVYVDTNIFYIDQGHGLQPEFEKLGVGQYWTYTNDMGDKATATVISIGSLTVPAGTFDNVYTVHYVGPTENLYQYWQPGSGLIQQADYTYGNGVQTHQLTSYATPVPPSAVLFGSALAGLIGFRRFRRS